MNPSGFFAELRRRNVYKVAIAYAIVGWLVMQVAGTIVPALHLHEAITSAVVVLVLLGFPIALVLAWAFEITPEGIKRAEDVPPNESITHRTGRKLTIAVVVMLAVALGLFAYQKSRSKPVAAQTATPASSEAVVGAVHEKSIAVLPFENLSDDKQNPFFTDGVQDEILTDLAKVADLKVISRTSVMQYKTGTRNLQEIGRALKISHVVEGSVQRSVNRVRVTAQLIDARNDTHVWAEKYDRELADVFAIQSEIAQTIADQLQAKLSPKEKAAIEEKPTKDMAAYDLYLRAKELDRSTYVEAERYHREVALLDEAVTRDPSFASAFCLLARAHLGAYWFNYDQTPARLELARKALDASARLEPDAGEVHLVRGLFYYWGNRDYAPALAELALARRTSPNDSDALRYLAAIERRQGHWAESTAHYEQAVAFDPRNAGLLDQLAQNYNRLRRYSDSIRIFDGLIAWKPLNFGFATSRAFVDVEQWGDLTRLEAACAGEAAKTADPKDVAETRLTLAFLKRDYHAAEKALAGTSRQDFFDNGFVQPRQFIEGIIAKELGDLPKAQAAFEAARERVAKTLQERPDDPKALSVLAQIDAEMGRKEDAIREGERSVELLPVDKDDVDGRNLLDRLAVTYAHVGEKSRALDLLEEQQRAIGLAYGWFKIDPVWDPLRNEPRFQKLLATLAPKDGKL
ncbi:MAG: TPR end-of-group domain-containing protein [Chthoniobacterales bacterium]